MALSLRSLSSRQNGDLEPSDSGPSGSPAQSLASSKNSTTQFCSCHTFLSLFSSLTLQLMVSPLDSHPHSNRDQSSKSSSLLRSP